MAKAKPKHLLDGYRVLDFTHFVAGPTATRMMAGMGAEIIKVELARHGDEARQMAYIRDKRSAYFVQQNRGKQSICVNMRKPGGLALVKELIPKADVLIENFAPGVIGSMGLDYATVKALNPSIVMCSISTFGQTGPLSRDPGFDFIGQAYAGITSLIGEEDGPPYYPMVAIGDVSTGVHASGAIGNPELARDPRYVTAASRVKHKKEIVELIEDWFASMPSDEASVDALRAKRVPVAPGLSVREAMNHPHLRERGTVRKVKDRVLGEFEIPGFPLRFSGFPEEL